MKINLTELGKITLYALGVTIFFYTIAIGVCSAAEINMNAIAQIESSGNPFAYNHRSGAKGVYQITKVCLDDYNAYHDKPIRSYELYDAKANFKVAHWYLSERIPSMLRYYRLPVNEDNILIAYNFGIGNLVKGKELPKETVNYIKKYRRLTHARKTN